MTLTELFNAIAAAIRSKDGTTASIPATTFPERIMALSGGGGGGGPFCRVTVESQGPNVVNIPVNISAEVSVTATDGYFDCDVVSVDGATYGFSLNDAGYYESQNKGVASSYAMCKIVFSSNYKRTIQLNCINYAQSNYDFGIISEVDTMLSLSNTADSEGVLKSFKGASSSSVVSVSVSIPAGDHFLCVKYRKNASTNSNNDTLQFAVSL